MNKKKDSYVLNMNRYGTHKIISEYIEKQAEVLDIGCNEGYLKTVCHKSCRFWGIDYRRQLLEIAKKTNKYEDIYMVDLNKSLADIKKKFDVLIFADILEHLIDPEKTLTFFVKNNLKIGGRVVISLPNVANILIRIKLLFGKFDYSESGILDKGHLHLYTTRSAIKLINSSGMYVNAIRYSSDRFGWIIDKFGFLANLFGYNIILVCKKRRY